MTSNIRAKNIKSNGCFDKIFGQKNHSSAKHSERKKRMTPCDQLLYFYGTVIKTNICKKILLAWK